MFQVGDWRWLIAYIEQCVSNGSIDSQALPAGLRNCVDIDSAHAGWSVGAVEGDTSFAFGSVDHCCISIDWLKRLGTRAEQADARQIDEMRDVAWPAVDAHEQVTGSHQHQELQKIVLANHGEDRK